MQLYSRLTTPVTPSSTAQSVSASLVYPTSVATLPGETPGPSFATVVSLVGCQSGTPCSSPSPIFAGTLQTACTTEVAPSPIPSFAMALPANGATAVPDPIGQLIVAGGSGGAYGLNSVTLTSQAGATIFASTPTPLPSPWPNNLATPGPYFEVAVPALAASTSYTMTVNWPTQSFVPPCVTTVPQTLGSLTMQ